MLSHWENLFSEIQLEFEFKSLVNICLYKIDKYLGEGCISKKLDDRLDYYLTASKILVCPSSMTEEIKREIRYLFYLHVVPRLHFDVAKAFKKMNEESERFSKIVEAV